MRCRECEILLWAEEDGELPEGQRHSLAAHIAACPRCARVYGMIRAFPLRIGQLSIVAPPPDFTARLMQRIAPLPSPSELTLPEQRGRQSPLLGPIGLVTAFSAAAAILLLGLFSTATIVILTDSPQNSAVRAGNPLSFSLSTMATLIWHDFSWQAPVALVGMLCGLALLWYSVVIPQRQR